VVSETDKVGKESLFQAIQKAFDIFFSFAEEIVGESKAIEFLQESYQLTEKYYAHISRMQLDLNRKLMYKSREIGDKEVLGFSLWMHKFMVKLSDFMIGIGHIEPEKMLGDLSDILKSYGFFDYYEQARELRY
jgi:hypothetical protein